MASVTSPTAATVRRLCGGLSPYVTGETEAAFNTRIDSFVVNAVNRVKLYPGVGETAYASSTWSAAQAEVLSDAVAYLAGALFLSDAKGRKALGVQEELLQEDSDRIENLAAEWKSESEKLITLVAAGASTSPFARPSVSSSTFAVTGSDRLPSEKGDLIDERDDVSSEDTDNG